MHGTEKPCHRTSRLMKAFKKRTFMHGVVYCAVHSAATRPSSISQPSASLTMSPAQSTTGVQPAAFSRAIRLCARAHQASSSSRARGVRCCTSLARRASSKSLARPLGEKGAKSFQSQR